MYSERTSWHSPTFYTSWKHRLCPLLKEQVSIRQHLCPLKIVGVYACLLSLEKWT